MKETYYFPHDYNARNDPKLQKVIMECGLEGLAVFWCLVEMMYEQGGSLSLLECDGYTFALRTNTDVLRKVISACFKSNKTHFWSDSVNKRLEERREKSERARKSVQRRWDKKDTNVIRSQYDPNTIKERKRKERKVNNKEIYKEKKPTSEDFQRISEDYQVPLAFVLSKWEDLENWCKSKGKTYRDYTSALRNFVKKDALKIKEDHVKRSNIVYAGDTLE